MNALSANVSVPLEIANLTKSYGGTVMAVRGISFSIGEGRMLGLLGPSGCGKSTTLRMIGGLEKVTSGEISVGGKPVTHEPVWRRNMGIVFQSYALFPHMSVARNVAFGLEMRKVSKAEIRDRVSKALDLVRLSHLGDRRPGQLSGGQQQRVALARALAIEPRILLLDEPLSNLDAKLREQMRSEIREIQQRLGITTIFVTHDQAEALAMCDLIGVMNAGNLEQLDTPTAIYERPATAFVAEFVGRTNRLGARRTGPTSVTMGTHVFRHAPIPGPLSEYVDIAIRPHRVRVVSPGGPVGPNLVRAQIQGAVYAGDLVQYEARVDDWLIRFEQSTDERHESYGPGATVELSWKAEDMMVFAREGAPA